MASLLYFFNDFSCRYIFEFRWALPIEDFKLNIIVPCNFLSERYLACVLVYYPKIRLEVWEDIIKEYVMVGILFSRISMDERIIDHFQGIYQFDSYVFIHHRTPIAFFMSGNIIAHPDDQDVARFFAIFKEKHMSGMQEVEGSCAKDQNFVFMVISYSF